MKSKFFFSMLLVLLAVSLGGMTSCKDDDDGKEETHGEESQVSDEQADKATKFWDVVSQLTSLDNYTADYEGKTFAPTIGEASKSNPLVRIVATNDMSTAAQRFAGLVGVESGIDASTTEYVWKDDAVGTLTYRQGDGTTAWATVDVSIRQLPGLQQIVYRSPEQAGENGSFRGSAYYRFGDVVKKNYIDHEDGNKLKTDYWVCVRPAFGPEGKETSHWISVSPLPMKNVWKKEKNGHNYAVPTGIGTNTEQMQNLAEMLYAIAKPDSWQSAIDHQPAPGIFTKGVPMFHDFSRKNKKYHNQFFWERVKKAWTEKSICDSVFGVDLGVVENMMNYHEGTGLHFLVKGYSWWATTSNNLTLYEYSYITDNESYTNHKVSHRDVKHDVSDDSKVINVVEQYTTEHPYLSNSAFFGDEGPRYIIRHATGADLVADGANWDVKQPISGVTPVYIYNYEYYPVGTPGGTADHFRDLTIAEPEVTVDPATGALPEAAVGCLVGENGKFYANKAACDAVQVKPVAMVVCYDAERQHSADLNRGATGLAIALNDYEMGGTKDVKWQNAGDDDQLVGLCATAAYGGASDKYKEYDQIINGLFLTRDLKAHTCNNSHEHPAAGVYGSGPEGCSNWFIPSVGQWILAMKGMGYTWEEKTGMNNEKYWGFGGNGNWTWQQAGVPECALDAQKNYWTSTQSGEDAGSVVCFVNNGFDAQKKNVTGRVRPMLLFGEIDDRVQIPSLDVTQPRKNIKPGYVIGSNGYFYYDAEYAREAKTKAVAMVVYYSADGKRVEKGQKWNGLAIAIENLNNGQTCTWADKEYIQTHCGTVAGTDSLFSHVFDGLAATAKIATDGHNHPAAKLAHEHDVLQNGGFSRWFLPSSGQWILANMGMGYEWGRSDEFFFGNKSYGFTKDGEWLWEHAGVKNAAMTGNHYWMSTEYGPDHEDRTLVMMQGVKTITSSAKTDEHYVRPFIAFGTGGTVDIE